MVAELPLLLPAVDADGRPKAALPDCPVCRDGRLSLFRGRVECDACGWWQPVVSSAPPRTVNGVGPLAGCDRSGPFG